MPKQKKGLEKIMKEREPTITLDMKTLPAIKKWKVGKEYEITLMTKMVGKREREDDDMFGPGSFGEFTIIDAEPGER